MNMASFSGRETAEQFQKGYHAVPISEAERRAHFVCVPSFARRPIRSRVFSFCCATPPRNRFFSVVYWTRAATSISGSNYGFRTSIISRRVCRLIQQTFTNHALDERWKRRAAFVARRDRSNKIEIGAETVHSLPIYFDVALAGPVNPKDQTSSEPWELCLEDSLLQDHGLPRFSTSLTRYLYVRGASNPVFLPMTKGCLRNESTREPEEVLGPVIPLNADGGLMMAQKFSPLSLESYADLLGGQGWKGIEEGNKVFKLDGVYRTLQNSDLIQQGGAHLFSGQARKCRPID